MHPVMTEAEVAAALRALPAASPPPFDFAELQRRTGSLRARRTARPGWTALPRAAVPVAAALCALLAGAALWSRVRTERATHATHVVHTVGTGQAPLAAPPASWPAPVPQEPQEPAIVRVSTRLAVTDLEDRIAAVDDVLSAEQVDGAAAARLTDLRSTRERLMRSLVQVRYAEYLMAEE